MTDPYQVLGIAPGADDESIKKAYRQKCKQYHPDLHPGDPTCEDKFKEVQAAYSEVMRQKNGGPQPSQGGYGGAGGYGGSYGSQGQNRQQQYQDPFGFGFDPFGFGFGGTYGGAGSGYGSHTTGQESPEMQAANNYIRNGYYQEALNVLNGISAAEHTARWHYYAALANSGLGNNIRAQSEARAAVDQEPGNYEYQNLLDRLQNPGQTYTGYQRTYRQPGSHMQGNFCLQAWLYLIVCNVCSMCCCGGRGGFYCC